TDDARYRVVLTFHHAILDGWSLPLVFRDVARAYRALAAGQEPRLGPARPYRDYVAWLGERDLANAEAPWRPAPPGLVAATPLPRDRGAAMALDEPARHGERKLSLPVAATGALKALGREHQITLSTFVQGALALLLGRHAGTNDVVFGVNVSG